MRRPSHECCHQSAVQGSLPALSTGHAVNAPQPGPASQVPTPGAESQPALQGPPGTDSRTSRPVARALRTCLPLQKALGHPGPSGQGHTRRPVEPLTERVPRGAAACRAHGRSRLPGF